FGLLAHRLGELRRGEAELLHQPEGLPLFDRAGLLVIAEQDQPRARHPADLEDANGLACPELPGLIEEENMAVGDAATTAGENAFDRSRFDTRDLTRGRSG